MHRIAGVAIDALLLDDASTLSVPLELGTAVQDTSGCIWFAGDVKRTRSPTDVQEQDMWTGQSEAGYEFIRLQSKPMFDYMDFGKVSAVDPHEHPALIEAAFHDLVKHIGKNLDYKERRFIEAIAKRYGFKAIAKRYGFTAPHKTNAYYASSSVAFVDQ